MKQPQCLIETAMRKRSDGTLGKLNDAEIMK
jgi:hypothetical protein